MLIAGTRASYKTITPKSALLQPNNPFQCLRPTGEQHARLPGKARPIEICKGRITPSPRRIYRAVGKCTLAMNIA
jgi:hypothetical protein